MKCLENRSRTGRRFWFRKNPDNCVMRITSFEVGCKKKNKKIMNPSVIPLHGNRIRHKGWAVKSEDGLCTGCLIISSSNVVFSLSLSTLSTASQSVFYSFGPQPPSRWHFLCELGKPITASVVFCAAAWSRVWHHHPYFKFRLVIKYFRREERREPHLFTCFFQCDFHFKRFSMVIFIGMHDLQLMMF